VLMLITVLMRRVGFGSGRHIQQAGG